MTNIVHAFRRLSLPCLLISILFLLCGCSTKKNTAISRNWQAFTTRYNVYFNGSEHYKETLGAMEKGYEDDYSRQLLVHPAEAKNDPLMPQPSGDFTRTIEKMQKAIQLHSIKKKPAKKKGTQKEKDFRAREEFNPFLHNAWLTMGKAQFHNGDFLGAASTFLYISKHFKWLPRTVTEARLWQARCYCAMDWGYEAENILRLVKPAELTTGALRELYNLTQADYLLHTDNDKEAAKYLAEAARSAKGSQKNRLWFLLGQVYARLGQKGNAYQAFRHAGAGAATAYRTKFNARIKQSEVFAGQNIKSEVNALRAMTRYQRNKEYLDQIYYAIGNLYLSRKDTAKAKENYILAVEKSTRQGIDKALAQVALGNIYFSEHEYVKAQPCYAEAVPQLSADYPGYKTLKSRSDVLDELAVYAGNVELQDSLLRLAAMTPEEQKAVCQKIVDDLIKKEKEEAEAARREAYLAEQEAKGQDGKRPGDAPQQNFQMNGDKSWYFYNTMTKNAGKTEFQRRWGARKLEDDWRRRNRQSFQLEEEPDDDGEADESLAETNDSISPEEKEMLEKENDPHNVEFYLKQIPKTDEEKQIANDIIQEGLYNMGVILKDKLEDFSAARSEFMRLESRYPDNIYRLDVYYNMYLMAVREGDKTEAERWRQKILTDFPDSPYGQAMTDPAYFDNLRRMNEIQEEMYARAYDAYLADDNPTVHAEAARMQSEYPLSELLPKFVFIDALSYATDGDTEKAKERLTELLGRWPDTDMTDMAASILKSLKAGRKPNSGGGNLRGMLWDTRLTDSDSDGTGADGQPANFERDPESPQYLVLAYPRDSVSSNALLYDVARFNFSSFVVKDFDLELMSFGNVGLLIVKGFSNLRELEHYRSVLATSDYRLPPQVRPIMISKPNFELLLREGRSFEEYFRFEEDAEAAATEEKVAGEGMTMPPGPDETADDEDSGEPDGEAAPEDSGEEASPEESDQPEADSGETEEPEAAPEEPEAPAEETEETEEATQ